MAEISGGRLDGVGGIGCLIGLPLVCCECSVPLICCGLKHRYSSPAVLLCDRLLGLLLFLIFLSSQYCMSLTFDMWIVSQPCRGYIVSHCTQNKRSSPPSYHHSCLWLIVTSKLCLFVLIFLHHGWYLPLP